MGNLLCSTIGHKWTQWKYSSENKCDLQKTCRRCGLEEEKKDAHILQEKLKYSSDEGCEVEVSCSRCDLRKTIKGHDYRNFEEEDPMHQGISGGMRCEFCGHTEYEWHAQHDYL